MGTPKKLLNMVRLSGDNFDLIRLIRNLKHDNKNPCFYKL